MLLAQVEQVAAAVELADLRNALELLEKRYVRVVLEVILLAVPEHLLDLIMRQLIVYLHLVLVIGGVAAVLLWIALVLELNQAVFTSNRATAIIEWLLIVDMVLSIVVADFD